ncbi:UDP-N-acetylglucosamine--N-acetylmuramyl-(pentapeptide) pyrophosphoryl-undecaprenol N-acetylglucosamine transferase [Candidatus Parcubacteria bacterium]|nr:MAG: UDP-N-acetylglucosamine--N-acetylmuramyl-(pentapeptide) pyrophosphoryl-undecaprenol N-acetylglucosamine transferase [Candidatus Parcubacteria bacterium]
MEKSSPVRILFTGGGSGGHTYPLLAVLQEMKRIAIERHLVAEFHYLGPIDDFSIVLQNEGVEIHSLVAGKLRRYASILNVIDIPKFFIGAIQALAKLFTLMPDVVFSKGGTGALPVVISSWFYRIPVIIHESDAAPGLTNLLSGKFSSRIAVSFDRALSYFNPQKTACIGAPIRPALLSNRPEKETAKEELGFNPKEPLVLILGGSQGSQRIDEFIVSNLQGLIQTTQVLHQTGTANYADTERLARAALADVPVKTEVAHRYQAIGFLDQNLKNALVAADLVVSRAGSGTIFEIAAFGKPSILIPLLESANNHQRINAYEFAKTGAAIVIEEENLLPGIFINQLRNVLKNKNLSNKMSIAAGQFFRSGAAEILAREIFRIARTA